MKRTIITLYLLITTLPIFAQQSGSDTVIVKLAAKSQLVLTVGDKADLAQLKEYDFQQLLTDIIAKIERNDSTFSSTPEANATTGLEPKENAPVASAQDDDWENYDEGEGDHKIKLSAWEGRRTRHSMNFDIGTNNIISDGKFVGGENELYTVKPWGSWYVGINSVQRTHIDGVFYLEWALGVSWYNFKFETENTTVSKDENTVVFDVDPRQVDFIKSKLTVSYINASLIPVFDFGSSDKSHRSSRNKGFRFGAGPYVGYRLDSYSKLAFKEDGERKRERDHDNLYLENLRYGVRVQLGYRDTDLFINYDLNDLFIENKGPKLNALSFGVVF